MVAVTLLEIRDQDGQLLGRQRLANLPLSIGRSADCDVILDDVQVSGAHARIEQGAEGPLLVDLGSRNGTIALEDGARVQQVPLRPGLRVRLGDTVLVFRGPDEARPSTQLAAAFSERRLPLDSWRTFALVAACAYGTYALLTVVESSRPEDVGAVLGPPFMIVGAAMIWGALWSLASRVLLRRFHYWGHAALGALGLLAVPVLSSACGAGGFALDLGEVFPVVTAVLFALAGAALLFVHFGWVSRWSTSRRAITALAVAASLGTVVWLMGRDESHFSTALPFTHTLEPPELRLRHGAEPADFFSRARELEKPLRADVESAK